MPVTDVRTDTDTLTLTMTAQFAAPLERVWELYADARQLEQVWGPPTHPATFVEHKLVPGTRTTYFLTGPDDERYPGWWLITDVDEPRGFAFDDGFGNDDLSANEELPVSQNTYRFEAVEGGTRAVYTSRYASADALQQVLDMGVVEGATSAINQIDEFLSR